MNVSIRCPVCGDTGVWFEVSKYAEDAGLDLSNVEPGHRCTLMPDQIAEMAEQACEYVRDGSYARDHQNEAEEMRRGY